jgi:hypothetical protein
LADIDDGEKRRLRLFEPPQAVSFQRPVSNDKYPSLGHKLQNARRDGIAGRSFLASSFALLKTGHKGKQKKKFYK